MAFEIKTDENMPATVVRILQERGYDARSTIGRRRKETKIRAEKKKDP